MTTVPVGDDAAMRAAVPAGLWSGKSVRAIAVDLNGAGWMVAEQDCDCWMRAKVRRLVQRVRAASGEESGAAVRSPV